MEVRKQLLPTSAASDLDTGENLHVLIGAVQCFEGVYVVTTSSMVSDAPIEHSGEPPW